MIINTADSNFNYTFQIPAENIGKAMKEHAISNSVAEGQKKILISTSNSFEVLK